MVRRRTSYPHRHLPTIATLLALVWIAGAIFVASRGTPATADENSTPRLFTTALGGPAPARYEERSEPITVDVRPTATTTPVDRRSDGEPRRARGETKNEKGHEKRVVPARDLGHSLPVATRFASDSILKQPHHDYPAVDLPLDTGTRVLAVTSGRVRATTKWGACGKGVILRGDDNFTYTFCHGSKLLVGRGRRVTEGEGIMRSGNTGDSTGPHLHLQIRRPNGKLICPQDLLPAWKVGKPTAPWEAGRFGCFTGRHRHSHKKGRR